MVLYTKKYDFLQNGLFPFFPKHFASNVASNVALLHFPFSRDVKPANIMRVLKPENEKDKIQSFCVYKLIDLGTAVGVSEISGESVLQASQSLMTFSTLEIAG